MFKLWVRFILAVFLVSTILVGCQGVNQADGVNQAGNEEVTTDPIPFTDIPLNIPPEEDEIDNNDSVVVVGSLDESENLFFVRKYIRP